MERLSDPSERRYSSAERYKRNLEKRQLRDLKKKEHSGPKKRKVLRLGQEVSLFLCISRKLSCLYLFICLFICIIY